ncbi:HesA/MoeB/ThiF family protein [Corallincola spongiicola]|uniref:Molybdopterin-synthase adenylyltransferase MoeB n=1 Tax=Corallincola spongiicola TaxID=2520508 RepID=A0ABY1WPA5_9GAMM|nr:molybdopterin-synthase adenylyltransferase MoeB [Corallincola spongiicola]TAA45778.1 molybdopterin-synthase adenylyltransferase MoeB [Corallincola spongiicola]
MLTNQEQLRYSRHLLLDDIGEAGQLKLKAASVLIVGMGGLGCPVAQYLVAAGVGRLLLADGDQLDLSNLQRQILYRSDDIGEDKVDLAQQTLQQLNDEIMLEAIPEHLDEGMLNEYIPEVDLVLDCSDNFATRHAVNRVCRQHGVLLITAAAIRFEGQLSAFDHTDCDAPCYHCLYPETTDAPRLNCSNSGVVGPLLGVMGSLQALEAVKALLGQPLTSLHQLRLFDGKTLQWHNFSINKDPQCPVCAK